MRQETWCSNPRQCGWLPRGVYPLGRCLFYLIDSATAQAPAVLLLLLLLKGGMTPFVARGWAGLGVALRGAVGRGGAGEAVADTLCSHLSKGR